MENMKKHFRALSVIVVLAFLSGLGGGILGSKLVISGGTAAVVSEKTSVEDHIYVEESETISAIDIVKPAVVSVSVYKNVAVSGNANNLFNFDFGSFFNFQTPQNQEQAVPEEQKTEYKQIAGGTGFIVTKEGLILTNKHVVQDEQADYEVTLSDGTVYDAEVVSRDPFDDIAVIKVVFGEDQEKVDLPIAVLGDSEKLQVGQKVLAIGNALAEYENTVTLGIVSAKGRDVSAYNEGGGVVENLSGLIQTDAAINPGNSGGPLVNLRGEVIGMNVAVAQSANGIGFAIPVDDLKPILDSVEKNGEIVKPVLGVRFLMLDEKNAKEYDVSVTHGALLIGNDVGGQPAIIPGGSADEAGLKSMDVILEVDGKVINADNPLHRVVRSYAPGDEVKMKVLRDGKESEISVILKSSKDMVSEENEATE